MSCGESDHSRIDLYLDGELRDEELESFNSHLKGCSSCRNELTSRRRFLEQVRAARPLYAAPAEFREEMAALLAASPKRSTIVRGWEHPVAGEVTKAHVPLWLLWLRSKPVPALAACFLVTAGIVS